MSRKAPLTVIFLLGIAAPALAEPTAAPAPVEYAFDDEQIDGSSLGPEGDIFTVRRPATRPSLIDLRTDFIPELTHTIEDL